jgi:hypothetical protein
MNFLPRHGRFPGRNLNERPNAFESFDYRVDSRGQMRTFLPFFFLCVFAAVLCSETTVPDTNRFLIFQNERYGYINSSGEIVIRPKYISARKFREGLAAVQLFDRTWAFIDREGVFVITNEYAYVQDFYDGLSWVLRKNWDKFTLIDMTGKIRLEPYFVPESEFHEGSALVRYRNLLEFFSTNNKFPSLPSFTFARPYSEGLASVILLPGHKIGFIDKKMFWVIPPQFDYADSFSDGMSLIRMNDLYGYIDKTGTIVIDCKYEMATRFKEGMARVSINSQWFFIDHDADKIYPSYPRASFFSEGLAAVQLHQGRDYKWGYINKKREVVIRPDFDWASDFTNGLAIVYRGKWIQYINKSANVVWQMPLVDTSNHIYH